LINPPPVFSAINITYIFSLPETTCDVSIAISSDSRCPTIFGAGLLCGGLGISAYVGLEPLVCSG
jgi:hypothetical protein